MNLDAYHAQELYSLGFHFRRLQENPHKGMVFQYEDSEWVIGGEKETEIENADMEIIKKGIWLPSEEELICWLQYNDFVFVLAFQGFFFEIKCRDSITGTAYTAEAPTPDLALFRIIKKVLTKGERAFEIKEEYFLHITTENQ